MGILSQTGKGNGQMDMDTVLVRIELVQWVFEHVLRYCVDIDVDMYICKDTPGWQDLLFSFCARFLVWMHVSNVHERTSLLCT